jgi:hypothetical protein
MRPEAARGGRQGGDGGPRLDGVCVRERSHRWTTRTPGPSPNGLDPATRLHYHVTGPTRSQRGMYTCRRPSAPPSPSCPFDGHLGGEAKGAPSPCRSQLESTSRFSISARRRRRRRGGRVNSSCRVSRRGVVRCPLEIPREI